MRTWPVHIRLETAPLRPDGQTTMVRSLSLLPVCLLVARLATGQARAQTASLEQAVAELETEASERALVTPEQAVAWFDDALFTFMIGDHEAAAERTWAVRPFLPPGPLRHEADHVLAVSLDTIGARTLAQRVNREILDEAGHPFAREAAALQVTLFAEHRTAAEFAALYDDLQARGLVEEATGDLAYAIGRAHWHLGHLDAAWEGFALVGAGEPAYDRARYHLAVIAVARDDLAEAARRFSTLREDPLTDTTIAELATLSLARIAFEEARLDDAASLYRMLGERSPRRATALEELAWTELRRGDLPAATLALEERLGLFPDDPSPEVQYTLGQLHLRFGDAAPAQMAFTTAIEAFEELLRAIPRLYADPVLPELLSGAERELPVLEAWTVDQLRRDERVVQAAHVKEAGRLADDGLQDAIELVRRLEERLLRDPSTERDRRLLADATRRLLDIADAQLRWADAHAEALTGRAAREERDTITLTVRAVADTRATLERLELLHTEGARTTAEEALATAAAVAEEAAALDGAAPAPHFEALGDRVRAIIERLQRQVGARDGPVHRRLAEEREALRSTAAAVDAITGHSEALWARARAIGTDALLGDVDRSLKGARSGLADASWERLVELRSEQARLVREHAEARAELDAVFDLVRRRTR